MTDQPSMIAAQRAGYADGLSEDADRLLHEITTMHTLLELAVRYLEHPDVTAINFTVRSQTLANRIRRAVPDIA